MLEFIHYKIKAEIQKGKREIKKGILKGMQPDVYRDGWVVSIEEIISEEDVPEDIREMARSTTVEEIMVSPDDVPEEFRKRAEAKNPKDNNLKNVLNDILNYILDHFALKHFAIGVVIDSPTSVNANFSVKKLGFNACYDCALSAEYNITGHGLEKSKTSHQYDWIEKDFPDVFTAVEHNAKRFERIETIDKHSTISGGLNLKLFTPGVSYQHEDKLRIYIYFEQ